MPAIARPSEIASLAAEIGPRRAAFAQFLAEGQLPAYKCAVEAGYQANSARQQSVRLQKDPGVIRMVELLKARRAREKGVNREWVIDRLVENVEGAMAEGQRAAANTGIGMLGRELFGMFADKKQVDLTVIDRDHDALVERAMDLIAQVVADKASGRLIDGSATAVDVVEDQSEGDDSDDDTTADR